MKGWLSWIMQTTEDDQCPWQTWNCGVFKWVYEYSNSESFH